MEPFEIAISDAVLDDLRQRLSLTRWPDEMPGVGWDYGSNLDYIKELCEYWRTDFDWRAQEQKLNAFNHYKSEVDGLSIHFIKEDGTGPNPMPLGDHPRLAQHVFRDDQDHPAAGRPGRTRRGSGGLV